MEETPAWYWLAHIVLSLLFCRFAARDKWWIALGLLGWLGCLIAAVRHELREAAER